MAVRTEEPDQCPSVLNKGTQAAELPKACLFVSVEAETGQ